MRDAAATAGGAHARSNRTERASVHRSVWEYGVNHGPIDAASSDGHATSYRPPSLRSVLADGQLRLGLAEVPDDSASAVHAAQTQMVQRYIKPKPNQLQRQVAPTSAAVAAAASSGARRSAPASAPLPPPDRKAPPNPARAKAFQAPVIAHSAPRDVLQQQMAARAAVIASRQGRADAPFPAGTTAASASRGRHQHGLTSSAASRATKRWVREPAAGGAETPRAAVPSASLAAGTGSRQLADSGRCQPRRSPPALAAARPSAIVSAAPAAVAAAAAVPQRMSRTYHRDPATAAAARHTTASVTTTPRPLSVAAGDFVPVQRETARTPPSSYRPALPTWAGTPGAAGAPRLLHHLLRSQVLQAASGPSSGGCSRRLRGAARQAQLAAEKQRRRQARTWHRDSAPPPAAPTTAAGAATPAAAAAGGSRTRSNTWLRVAAASPSPAAPPTPFPRPSLYGSSAHQRISQPSLGTRQPRTPVQALQPRGSGRAASKPAKLQRIGEHLYLLGGRSRVGGSKSLRRQMATPVGRPARTASLTPSQVRGCAFETNDQPRQQASALLLATLLNLVHGISCCITRSDIWNTWPEMISPSILDSVELWHVECCQGSF